MSVVVAEEGNRRIGDMTAEEAEQCVVDIKTWFVRNGRESMASLTQASQVDIQRLEKTLDGCLPIVLKTLLLEVDGDIFYMDKRLLSCQRIMEVLNNVESSRKWKFGYVPMFGDDFSMILFDSTSGYVYEWDQDDGLGDSLSNSLSSFLENYRNLLLGGQCEYLRDLGVVETMSSKK